MGFYAEQVLPRIINVAMNTGEMKKVRARACAGLAGEVVEIGFGSGLNIPHYPSEVTRVLAVEPSDTGWKLSERRRAESSVIVERAGVDGQRLDLPDEVADTAVSTWTLCTIPDAVAAAKEVRRMLKPGGRFHFVEHGLSPHAKVAKWQHRWEPMQKKMFGGCHVTREATAILEAAGLVVEGVESFYAKGDPKVLGWLTLGTARKP